MGRAEDPGPTLRFEDARGLTRLVSGAVDPARTSLFAVVRDEAFFLPAFFAHYRALGIEQFLILDDGSIDGGRDFLAAQPDCALLEAGLRYGAPVVQVAPDGRRAATRAGVYFKAALPRAWLGRGYVTYVDADEFLLMPPGVAGVPEVVARLAARGDACAVAAIVEFFPERAAALRGGGAPAGLADLLDAYGWFQPEPMAEVGPDGFPRALGRSKSQRLFERHGVRVAGRGLRGRLRRLVAPEYRRSPQFKTPFFRCDADTWLTGTHECNRPAARDVLLTIGHFVFTAQFADKIDRALAWRSYLRGSEKYEHYRRLLARLDAGDGALTDARSVRFASAGQLAEAGLLRW